jgi:hypothetical protein
MGLEYRPAERKDSSSFRSRDYACPSKICPGKMLWVDPLLWAENLDPMGEVSRGVAQRAHRSSTENGERVLNAKVMQEHNRDMQRLRRAKFGIFVGVAPVIIFVLLVYSLALHANLAAGEFPSVPTTALFKAHDSLAMNFANCWLFLLLGPLGVFSILGIAKGVASVLPGGLAFIISLLMVWLLIKVDPFQIFNWFFT